MYITYEEYKALGGNAEEPLFNRMELQARLSVDKATYHSLKELETLPENLTSLMFELISLDEKNNVFSNSLQAKSESNNGISVTYDTISSEDLESEKGRLIRVYLDGVTGIDGNSIFYAGVKNVSTFCNKNNHYF